MDIGKLGYRLWLESSPFTILTIIYTCLYLSTYLGHTQFNCDFPFGQKSQYHQSNSF